MPSSDQKRWWLVAEGKADAIKPDGIEGGGIHILL